MTLPALLLSLSAAHSAPRAPVRAATATVQVDGRLDEADWAAQDPITDLVRYQPAPGGPHPSQTEVRFLQSDTHLYVGVRVTGAQDVRAHISPREDVNVDDQIGVYIDPFGDARTGYIFYVNLHGIQQDIRYAYGAWYLDWDTVWQSAGRRIDGGYELEVALPFRSLRYPETDGPRGVPEQDWTVMITRKIPAEGVKLSWPAMQPRHPRTFEQGARLTGVRPSSKGAGVELLPVTALRGAWSRGPAGTGPLAWSPGDRAIDTVRPGFDARVGLTPDLGIAATALPDFSQVEGDVLQVDLNQRFAFFYPEQRPFFLDGVDTFEDQNDTLYTRSVGDPIYGVKLSGQAERLGIGVLHALDRTPGPSIHERGTPGFDAAGVEGAQATTAFARTRWDLAQNGYVGITAADRRLVRPDGLDAGLAQGAASDVFSLDSRVPLGEVWTASGFGSVSHAGVPGDRLLGGRAGGSVAREPALGTGGALSAEDLTPGYRNELGYLTQSGLTRAAARVNHTVELPGDANTATSQVSANLVEERDQDRQRFAEASQAVTLAGNHELVGWGGLSQYEQAGVSVDGWQAGGAYEALLSNALSMEVAAERSRVLDYGDLVPADATRTDLEINLRPTVGTRLDLLATWQWFTPEGQSTQRAARYWSRFNVQMTREWGVRLIGQTTLSPDIASPTVAPSALLTWIRHPGTEAYIGATGTVETDGRGLTELGLFAKLSWLFRL